MPVSIKITTIGMDEVTRGLQEMGVAIMPVTRRQIFNTLLGIRNTLTAAAPRPTHPINWDSEKQRRAYFATEGFGGGIPSHRTGRYQRSWRVIRVGADYAIDNPDPAAVYIGGDEQGTSQSRIHQSRWPLSAPLIFTSLNAAPSEIEDAIEQMAKEKGL
jgi:hypothetical protein